jgi:hypothetical protein
LGQRWENDNDQDKDQDKDRDKDYDKDYDNDGRSVDEYGRRLRLTPANKQRSHEPWTFPYNKPRTDAQRRPVAQTYTTCAITSHRGG